MVVDQSAWQAVERAGDRLQETLHAVATGEAREMPTI
jgi:hypothetical protein